MSEDQVHLASFSHHTNHSTLTASLVHQSLYITSQPRLSPLERLPLRLPKRHVNLPSRTQPEEPILAPFRNLTAHELRIHPFLPQRHLILLMVVNVRATPHDPQENRHRVLRQALRRVHAQLLVESIPLSLRALLQVQRRTARPPFMARHRHAVDVRLRHAGDAAQTLGDLGGRDVLALPAERVAEAIHEVPLPVVVSPQRVARPVVHVALPEDVLREALLRRAGGPPVALEGVLVGDRDEELAALVVGAAAREARGGVAPDVAGLVVDGDGDVDVVHEAAQDEAVVADAGAGEGTGVVVDQREHALGGVEELGDLGDVEAGFEFFPHVGAEAVAVAAAEVVGALEGVRGRVDEVAGCFADVDEEGAVGLVDVGPKVGDAEAWGQGEGDAADEAGHACDAACAVVEGHTVVPLVDARGLFEGGLEV